MNVPPPRGRRRYLSDDVRERATITTMESAPRASLPLARPSVRVPQSVEKRPVPADTAIVQTQREEGAGGETDTSASTRPSAQQIADRVYQFMCRDLRLERERTGW